MGVRVAFAWAAVAALDVLAGCGPREGQPGDLESLESPLVGAAAKKTRTIAAMMFDIGAGAPDKAQIQDLLLGAGNSQRHMYREISFGMQDLEVDFLGPYKLPQATCLPIECCGPKPSQPNGPAVADIIAALPTKYDHYFWVYGPIPGGATCGTWGDEGSPVKPAVYSSFSFHSLVGYSQELGHNFGMTHEPFMNCNGKTLDDDTTKCTHQEYGSPLSFMGSTASHPSAFHKQQQGWLTQCNVVKVGGSVQVKLLPQELACNGTQLLQIPAPKSRPAPAKGDRQGMGATLTHYYVEMRAPYGFDSKMKPMVVVYLGPTFANPSAIQGAPYVYLLDQSPATPLADPGLTAAGATFRDPSGGLTITVDAIDAKSATVSITTTGTQAASLCGDDRPFTAPGLDETSCSGLGQVGAGDGGATMTGDAGTPIDAGATRDAARLEGGAREAAALTADAAGTTDGAGEATRADATDTVDAAPPSNGKDAATNMMTRDASRDPNVPSEPMSDAHQQVAENGGCGCTMKTPHPWSRAWVTIGAGLALGTMLRVARRSDRRAAPKRSPRGDRT